MKARTPENAKQHVFGDFEILIHPAVTPTLTLACEPPDCCPCPWMGRRQRKDQARGVLELPVTPT